MDLDDGPGRLGASDSAAVDVREVADFPDGIATVVLVSVDVEVAAALLGEGEESLAVVVELVLLAGVDDGADEVLALGRDGPVRGEYDVSDGRILSFLPRR